MVFLYMKSDKSRNKFAAHEGSKTLLDINLRSRNKFAVDEGSETLLDITFKYFKKKQNA